MPLYKSLPQKKKGLSLDIEAAHRFAEFLYTNKRMIAVAVVAVLCAAGLAGGVQLYLERYSAKATALLLEKPFNESEGVVQKYSRSPAAQVARMALADKAIQESRWDDAIGQYEKVLRFSAADLPLRIAAMENMALAFKGKGDLPTGLAYLKRAEADPRNANPEYTRLLIARVLKEQGDAAGSEKMLKELSDNASWAPVKEEATQWIKPPEPEKKPKKKRIQKAAVTKETESKKPVKKSQKKK